MSEELAEKIMYGDRRVGEMQRMRDIVARQLTEEMHKLWPETKDWKVVLERLPL